MSARSHPGSSRSSRTTHLDSVSLPVEELDSSDLVQDRVGSVIGHVVGDDGGERVPLEGKDSSLEQNLVLLGEELVVRENLGSMLTEGIRCSAYDSRMSSETEEAGLRTSEFTQCNERRARRDGFRPSAG